jgi:glutamate-1-semialdehyde aminotransferase
MTAIQSALEKGTSFGAPTVLESELAERVIAAVPSMELVRMVNSGTEATMSAIRVARGFTGREIIVKFAGCYHGHVDSLAPASGQEFALLPPDNATGNFTKVVQRIPVKIVLDGDAAENGDLRPGMSVQPSIDTKNDRS